MMGTKIEMNSCLVLPYQEIFGKEYAGEVIDTGFLEETVRKKLRDFCKNEYRIYHLYPVPMWLIASFVHQNKIK